MTDTSLPPDGESTTPAAGDAPAETPTPGASAPAGASSPVTEHPAHDIVSELLDALKLQGVEHVFRSVFEWLGRHASSIGDMSEKIAPQETAAADEMTSAES